MKNLLDNETVKKGLTGVADVAKMGCAIVVPIVVTAFARKSAEKLVDRIYYGSKVGYDDAIKAILNSSMMSSYKTEAVSLVKVGRESDYYRAVIHTVNSDMMSSYKIDVIKELSGKDEETKEKGLD